jgi:hypothetical protein
MSLEILTHELPGAIYETNLHLVAEQTPTDEICPTACPDCRTFEQVGGNESEYLASLEKAFQMASYQKQEGKISNPLIDYLTGQQTPKIIPTIPFLMELGKKYDLELEVIILIQGFSSKDKANLNKEVSKGLNIIAVELSESDTQKGGKDGLYVGEYLGSEASISMIRNRDNTIRGYERLGTISNQLLTEDLPQEINRKYKFDPSKILIRGLVDKNGIPLNESIAVVDSDKLISKPESILPIGVYPELSNLPSIRANLLIDNYGKSVTSF